VGDLGNVVDMETIRRAGVTIGVAPLGGAGVHYWGSVADRYGISVSVVNDAVNPTFRCMTVDWGRPDPDGLLVAICDGDTGRYAGSLRHRVRQ
jgi:phosphoglucomutase